MANRFKEYTTFMSQYAFVHFVGFNLFYDSFQHSVHLQFFATCNINNTSWAYGGELFGLPSIVFSVSLRTQMAVGFHEYINYIASYSRDRYRAYSFGKNTIYSMNKRKSSKSYKKYNIDFVFNSPFLFMLKSILLLIDRFDSNNKYVIIPHNSNSYAVPLNNIVAYNSYQCSNPNTALTFARILSDFSQSGNLKFWKGEWKFNNLFNILIGVAPTTARVDKYGTIIGSQYDPNTMSFTQKSQFRDRFIVIRLANTTDNHAGLTILSDININISKTI